ncbi:hypothetical protein AB0M36_05325 [Actinoplanes sp. NPDC051346]|uniref:hypothetical protein n=1 Tax=Actinoplanes sp. NPDC051346 TaxID=3155048 RepID=UPI003429E440
MRRMPVSITVATTFVLLGIGGCSSEEPPVCDSIDAAQATMGQIRNANVSENGLNELKADLRQFSVDLQQVATDAAARFGSEIDAVKLAASQFSTSVAAAQAAPDATSLASVRASRVLLEDSVQRLDDAVSETC